MDSDPEDILSTSLETLYRYTPITYSSAGSLFSYTTESSSLSDGSLVTISLRTPDTSPSNWSLHASSIWVSSLYISDHITDLCLKQQGTTMKHVLELGAGSGLPSILIAKTHDNVVVTASDYPDDYLIRALSENINMNSVSERCRVIPYAWGAEISAFGVPNGFDFIIAADTIWNPELHTPFVDTLCLTLKKSPESRIHLVAGLHTGRYTIQAFLNAVTKGGLCVESAVEREVNGDARREWSVARADGEDEQERRRWIIWIIIKWG